MYGDFLSTVTMAGAYTQAVKAAHESDVRQNQKYQNNHSNQEKRQAEPSLFTRLRQSLATRVHRQSVKANAQTPAE